MVDRITSISSQAWYFLFALLGVVVAALPLFHHADPGAVTAYVGLGSTLVGVAANGIQSDSKRSTTVEKDGKIVSSTSTVATPSAPSSPTETK